MQSRYLLALETSGKAGSVALITANFTTDSATLFNDDSIPHCVDAVDLDVNHGSAKTLAPAIDELLQRNSIAPDAIQAIAVTQGPGSFTGLRVGIATAKVMAYALNIPVIPINTLDVVATQLDQAQLIAPQTNSLYCAIDAFRGQSFFAHYRRENQKWVAHQGTEIADNDRLSVAILNTIPANANSQFDSVWIAGPSIGKLLQSLSDLPTPPPQNAIRIFQGPEAIPTAKMVGILGWEAWIQGKAQDPFALLPQYYRSSAAEEKRAQPSSNGYNS